MRTSFLTLAGLLTVLLLAGPARAQSRLYVDAGAPPAGDGLSWSTAFRDLQDALTAAMANPNVAELWVAQGTYEPDHGTGQTSQSFALRSDFALFGGFAGNETSFDQRDALAHPSILSGDLSGDDAPGFGNRADNSTRVIVAIGVTNAILDGFEVRGGNAASATDFGGAGGGGLLCSSAQVRVANCTFHDNDGSGIAAVQSSDLVLFACTILANRGVRGGGVFHNLGRLTATDTEFLGNQTTAQEGGGLRSREGRLFLRRCSFTNNQSVNRGGGLSVALPNEDTLSADLSNCVFEHNTAVNDGGGVHGFASNVGRAQFRKCRFRSNTGAGGGGLLWHSNSDVAATLTLTDCSFEDNLSVTGAGIAPGRGGGVFATGVRPDFVRCSFTENRAFNGGGAFLERSARARIYLCSFRSNSATTGEGGGALMESDALEVVSCLFASNVAVGSGSGLLAGPCPPPTPPRIVSSTFVNNRSSAGVGAGLSSCSTASVVANCIMWGNRVGGQGGQATQVVGPTALQSCCVEDLVAIGGVDNFAQDPMFFDPLGADDQPDTLDDDWSLRVGSPCIDRGNASVFVADSLDLDGDTNLLEAVPWDLAGNSRRINDPNAADNGIGANPQVDLGSYESQGCIVTSFCATSPNGVGPGAVLDATGSTSVAANDFTLMARAVPPGKFGVFFYGSERCSVPFGNGLRCVDGGSTGLARLIPAEAASGAGTIDRPLDFTLPPAGGGANQITSATTWHFQLWYRDPAGPGGTGVNLSDALSATFCP